MAHDKWIIIIIIIILISDIVSVGFTFNTNYLYKHWCYVDIETQDFLIYPSKSI